MMADPLEGYDPKAVTKDPLTGYTPSRQYQAPDWIPGAQYLQKVTNSFDDAFTGRMIDPATAWVGEKLRGLGIKNSTPDTATLRAQTAQDRADTPIGSMVADVAAYGTGVGKLGVGNAVTQGAAKVLPGMASRMIGQGAENALWSGVSSLGSGNSYTDAAKDAGVGGLIGTVTGALPGGGPKPKPGPATEDLSKTASSLYKPLEQKVYQTPDIAAGVDRASANVSQGLQAKISPSLTDQIDRINQILAKGTKTTASDIADFRSSLLGAARNDTDMTIAGQYVSALEKGVGPKITADIKTASGASNVAKTSADIDKWLTDPKGAPKAVKSALENNPNFYKTQPGLFDALNTVAKRAEDPPLWKQLRDYAAKAAIGGGIGYGVGQVFGGNPAQSTIEGALGGIVAPHLGKIIRAAPISRELQAAGHLNATGVPVDPRVYTPNWLKIPGMLARTTGGAIGVSNPLERNRSQ
jgi:hypothetical protein